MYMIRGRYPLNIQLVEVLPLVAPLTRRKCYDIAHWGRNRLFIGAPGCYRNGDNNFSA